MVNFSAKVTLGNSIVKLLLLIIVFSACLIYGNLFDGKDHPWNLPVTPKSLPPIKEMMFSKSEGMKIPRHMWMAFKNVPPRTEMKGYLLQMIRKNEARNWTMHLEDNDAKLKFMETYYANTSLLWAYKAIHPHVGNSAADIWRYGVLWMLGGMYMDDDSYLESSFDEVMH